MQNGYLKLGFDKFFSDNGFATFSLNTGYSFSEYRSVRYKNDSLIGKYPTKFGNAFKKKRARIVWFQGSSVEKFTTRTPSDLIACRLFASIGEIPVQINVLGRNCLAVSRTCAEKCARNAGLCPARCQ